MSAEHRCGQHVAYFDDGEFHWMSGIAPRNCELYASPPKAVTITDEMVTMVRELEEACNSARTALAGMTSVQSAIDKLDCRPLNVSHLLAALSSEARNG